MKTKLKGNVRYFQYKGDILKEMQKCEKELEKIVLTKESRQIVIFF